jgi:outer membrane lipoprotein-sorting protein
MKMNAACPSHESVTSRSLECVAPGDGWESAAAAYLKWAGPLLLLAFVMVNVSEGAHVPKHSELLTAWLAAQTNIQTWSADLVQTRTLKALQKPLTAEGRVWFAAPNRFRWEIGTPPQTVAVRNTNVMLVIYPKLKRAERYQLGGSATGQWRDALELLEAGFPRSAAELDARFNVVSETRANDLVELELQPRSVSARRMIPRIRIGFSAIDFSLRFTELRFSDGSTMRNDFHKAQLNPVIDEGLFSPKPGEDYKIVEPLAQ